MRWARASLRHWIVDWLTTFATQDMTLRWGGVVQANLGEANAHRSVPHSIIWSYCTNTSGHIGRVVHGP